MHNMDTHNRHIKGTRVSSQTHGVPPTQDLTKYSHGPVMAHQNFESHNYGQATLITLASFLNASCTSVRPFFVWLRKKQPMNKRMCHACFSTLTPEHVHNRASHQVSRGYRTDTLRMHLLFRYRGRPAPAMRSQETPHGRQPGSGAEHGHLHGGLRERVDGPCSTGLICMRPAGLRGMWTRRRGKAPRD